MLSATFKAELQSLSLEEKLEVLESIRSSVEPPSESTFSELSPAQEKELLRRSEQAISNPGSGRTWAEVKQRILDA